MIPEPGADYPYVRETIDSPTPIILTLPLPSDLVPGAVLTVVACFTTTGVLDDPGLNISSGEHGLTGAIKSSSGPDPLVMYAYSQNLWGEDITVECPPGVLEIVVVAFTAIHSRTWVNDGHEIVDGSNLIVFTDVFTPPFNSALPVRCVGATNGFIPSHLTGATLTDMFASAGATGSPSLAIAAEPGQALNPVVGPTTTTTRVRDISEGVPAVSVGATVIYSDFFPTGGTSCGKLRHRQRDDSIETPRRRYGAPKNTPTSHGESVRKGWWNVYDPYVPCEEESSS